MEKIITYETLSNYAYSNDRICKHPIKGIVISFFGLGKSEMYSDDTDEGKYYAERGIIYIIPYNNPWAWMNKQAVAYTDELVDVIINIYQLPNTIPVVSSGGSMGGQSALVYMVYSKRTPVACVVNCPVCDLPFHFTERKDLPRTLYSAFFNESGTMEEALKSASPLHLVDRMPDSEYYIFHCEKDLAVNKEKHSDVFVEAMIKKHRVTYHAIPERGHCDLTEDMWELYKESIICCCTA